ncbi:MAG TPA: DsbA family oxidoreductase [Hanamia sp.]|nr:DsbA family oxidoreductase [Hanamia sp.]
MKVNIWSDVRCPFCYIGKRKFEMALEKFPHKDKVEVNWHSFELDPNLETKTGANAIDHLAEAKGISREQAEGMHNNVKQIAKEVGLDFDFVKSVVANSFNAHRLIQLFKTKGLDSEVKEQLFEAHFIDGKNIDDNETLVQTGVAAGLQEKEIREVLASDAFSKEVQEDEMQAQSIGVRGVPFFVLNDKYAVSGAQSPDTFLEVLEQTWKEFEQENKTLILAEGESCSADGTCN